MARGMLRFVAPYFLFAAVVSIAGGAAYGAGSITVPVLYGFMFAAIVVAGLGYARWDERRHPPRR
jgi:hypothetical protein